VIGESAVKSNLSNNLLKMAGYGNISATANTISVPNHIASKSTAGSMHANLNKFNGYT